MLAFLRALVLWVLLVCVAVVTVLVNAVLGLVSSWGVPGLSVPVQLGVALVVAAGAAMAAWRSHERDGGR